MYEIKNVLQEYTSNVNKKLSCFKDNFSLRLKFGTNLATQVFALPFLHLQTFKGKY